MRADRSHTGISCVLGAAGELFTNQSKLLHTNSLARVIPPRAVVISTMERESRGPIEIPALVSFDALSVRR